MMAHYVIRLFVGNCNLGVNIIFERFPGTARSSTWVKVASASNRWRIWLSTHEARRVEVERAKGRGCLTRSVKLAQLVHYSSFSAEAVTIARSAAPPAREWSAGMRAT